MTTPPVDKEKVIMSDPEIERIVEDARLLFPAMHDAEFLVRWLNFVLPKFAESLKTNTIESCLAALETNDVKGIEEMPRNPKSAFDEGFFMGSKRVRAAAITALKGLSRAPKQH